MYLYFGDVGLFGFFLGQGGAGTWLGEKGGGEAKQFRNHWYTLCNVILMQVYRFQIHVRGYVRWQGITPIQAKRHASLYILLYIVIYVWLVKCSHGEQILKSTRQTGQWEIWLISSPGYTPEDCKCGKISNFRISAQ